MSALVPVWVWLPRQVTPVCAAHLDPEGDRSTFQYVAPYLNGGEGLALDPVQLRLRKAGVSIPRSMGLPFVCLDAKPAGYGQDRLNANAGRDLSAIELLEMGPSDSVGAIEVCHDIDRKLNWRPKPFSLLADELALLEEDAPSSRAIRRVNGDAGTSAGGERPKATFEYEGRQWLVKMQDRGDLPGMPAREFVAMSLAKAVGIDVPDIKLMTHGAHQVFMIARFDRAGAADKPQRMLFASAQSVLQLEPSAVRGDPRRSYLHLADRMRSWGAEQTQELWRRMVFNALVGNNDDHPRNHGLLHDGMVWRLSPAFDITPVFTPRDGSQLGLAMATGMDGAAGIDVERLLAAAPHFGLGLDDAAKWIGWAACLVSERWEVELRQAMAPLLPVHRQEDALVSSVRGAFDLATALAVDPGQIDEALERQKRQKTRRRSLRM